MTSPVFTDTILKADTTHTFNIVNSREYMANDADGRHYVVFVDGTTSVVGLQVWSADYSTVSQITDIGLSTQGGMLAWTISPDGTELHVLTPNTGGVLGVHMWDVVLSGTPLPDTVDSTDDVEVDGTDTYKVVHTYRLTSGADVVCAVLTGPLTGGNYPQYPRMYYRPHGGAFATPVDFTWSEDEPTESFFGTLTQHPGDGAVWAFLGTDDLGAIDAFRFTVNAGNVVLANTYNHFVPHAEYPYQDPQPPPHSAGAFGGWGVLPDPFTNSLLFVYEDSSYGTQMVDNSELLTRDGISIGHISAAGVLTIDGSSLLDNANGTEQGLALAIEPGGAIWVAYRVTDINAGTSRVWHATRWNRSAWETPIVLGSIWEDAGKPIGSGNGTVMFLGQAAPADSYQCHQYLATPSIVYIPPPLVFFVQVTVNDRKGAQFPVEGATVTLGNATVYTDAQGNTQVPQPAATGNYTLVVSKTGYTTAQQPISVVALAPTPPTTIRLRQQRGHH